MWIRDTPRGLSDRGIARADSDLSLRSKLIIMSRGKVKWFNDAKGFGFITEDNGQDVFVHHSEIKSDGYRTLEEGEPVEFEVIAGEKGPRAKNVQRLGPQQG